MMECYGRGDMTQRLLDTLTKIRKVRAGKTGREAIAMHGGRNVLGAVPLEDIQEFDG